MGLGELCDRLGVEYTVRYNEQRDLLSVTLYTDKRNVWAYRESFTGMLSGLFKEVYGKEIEKLIPNGVSLLDKLPKK